MQGKHESYPIHERDKHQNILLIFGHSEVPITIITATSHDRVFVFTLSTSSSADSSSQRNKLADIAYLVPYLRVYRNSPKFKKQKVLECPLPLYGSESLVGKYAQKKVELHRGTLVIVPKFGGYSCRYPKITQKFHFSLDYFSCKT